MEMTVRNLARAIVMSVGVVTLPSLPVTAQVVTFSTSGSFNGGSCIASSCTFGGFTLTYAGRSSASWLAPTNVDLGNFVVTCNACTPGSSAAILAGSTFTLTVTQTMPAPGTTSFTGSLTGTLNWNPSGSSLFWNPSSGSTQIANLPIETVTYAMIEQDQGGGPFGIDIVAPTVGNNPTSTIVKAHIAEQITATPEPATLALTAIGLTALIPVARRRRV
jgi:hypothetical protein